MRLINFLLRHRGVVVVDQLLLLLGIEIPAGVLIGDQFTMHHRGRGVVMTPHATIGNRVTIFHNVTLGLAHAHTRPKYDWDLKLVILRDDTWVFPGAVVLGQLERPTVVGRGTIVAANAVLTQSTGDWEIWGGVPARKLADRPLSEWS